MYTYIYIYIYTCIGSADGEEDVALQPRPQGEQGERRHGVVERAGARAEVQMAVMRPLRRASPGQVAGGRAALAEPVQGRGAGPDLVPIRADGGVEVPGGDLQAQDEDGLQDKVRHEEAAAPGLGNLLEVKKKHSNS